MSSGTGIDLKWLEAQFPNLSNLNSLAAGGQKFVFIATHPTHGDVVLKLVRPGSDFARTERELVAAAKIAGGRTPKIYGHGTIPLAAGELAWFIEQRIFGEPLSSKIKGRVLPVNDLLKLALHVAETLAVSEQVSIVHRDVKPDNIIVDVNGDYWLIDFGVARHLALESLTATVAIGGCGTLGYAPIEQCRNDKPNIDARADMFALGVTLYVAATGINPFLDGANTPFEVISRIEKNPLPRLGPPISAAFADFVQTISQPNIIHRCRSASEAYEWIKALCDKENIE